MPDAELNLAIAQLLFSAFEHRILLDGSVRWFNPETGREGPDPNYVGDLNACAGVVASKSIKSPWNAYNYNLAEILDVPTDEILDDIDLDRLINAPARLRAQALYLTLTGE